MADFTALKSTIQNYIKQNGNEEITGNILQEVLLAMVQTMGDGAINDLVAALAAEVTNRQNADGTLQTNINNEANTRSGADTALGNSITAINTKLAEGYVYAGIATAATNPGTPSGKVFYIATAAGTYTNFGGTVLTQGINILKYDGSAWSGEQLIGVDDVPTAGSNNLVKSGGVDKVFKNRSWFITGIKNMTVTRDGNNFVFTFSGIFNVFDKLGGYYSIAAGTYTLATGKALYLSTTDNTFTAPDFTTKGLGTYLYLVSQDILDVEHNDFLVAANWVGSIYSPFARFYPYETNIKALETGVHNLQNDLIVRSWFFTCNNAWAEEKRNNTDIILHFPNSGIVYDKLGGYRVIQVGDYTLTSGKVFYMSTTENSLTLPDFTVKGTGETLYLVAQDVLDDVHSDYLFAVNWAGGLYIPFACFSDKFIASEKKSYTGIGVVNRVRANKDVTYPLLKDIISFDKSNMVDLKDAVEGYYFIYGDYAAVTGYVAMRNPIPLKRNTTYTIYSNNAHVDIIDAATFKYIAHVPRPTQDDPDLSIVTDGDYKQFTLPNTDLYNNCMAIVTFRTQDVNIGWLNEGTIADLKANGHYTAFQPTLGKQSHPRRIIVDIKGCGDFTSLTEACVAAADGDTIILYPGLYDNECCTAPESKTLHIIGVDREQCIIRGRTDADYFTPPMHFSSGRIANLTIIQQKANATGTDVNAYCIHMDMNNMKNHTINIDNCNFVNNNRAGCLGIGLRGGCILTVKGCRFTAPNGGRTLFLHDNDYDNAQYEGLQIFRSVNCIYDLQNPETGDKSVVINGCGKETQAYTRDFSVSQFYIEFIMNRIKGGARFANVYSAEVGTITADDFQGVKNLRLADLSWGNSDSVFNSQS